jgi:hypothetical protein
VEAMMSQQLKTMMKFLVIVAVVAVLLGVSVKGHQHLRSRDGNEQSGILYTKNNARAAGKSATYPEKSSLVSGSLFVSTFHSNGDEKTYQYCMTYPEECDLDPSIVNYRLSHCIPDPLGQAVAVKVLADTAGNIVLTSFSDANCTAEVNHTLKNTSSRESSPKRDTKYEIRTDDTLSPLPNHFVKEYYFDEACSGPHSKVALGSYTLYDMRTGVCWNDSYNGQSYIATYSTNEMSYQADPSNHTVGTATVELCAFDVPDCSGCDFAFNSGCNATYTCYGSDSTVTSSIFNLSGNNQCVKEADHYVLSSFVKMPTKDL